MENDLEMLSQVIQWAKAQRQIIQDNGVELSDNGMDLARSVGVEKPDMIRVMLVERIPLEDTPFIYNLAKSTGMLTGKLMGMTFGHAIYIVRGSESSRLYSHEFRHVHQYENFGSIEASMEEYLHQVLTFSYDKAPLELDAKKFEVEHV